jgi:hypothetical protein
MAQATDFISWLRSFVEKDDPKPTAATTIIPRPNNAYFNTGSFVPVGKTPITFDTCTDLGKGLYIHAINCHCKRGFIETYRKMIFDNHI